MNLRRASLLAVLLCLPGMLWAGALDYYRNIPGPSRLFLHAKAQTGDYAVLKTGFLRQTQEIIASKEGRFWVKASNATDGAGMGGMAPQMRYEFVTDATGKVESAELISEGEPMERLALKIATGNEAGVIPAMKTLQELGLDKEKVILEEFARLGQWEGNTLIVKTPAGTFRTEVRAFFQILTITDNRGNSRELPTVLTYAFSPEVKFQTVLIRVFQNPKPGEYTPVGAPTLLVEQGRR